MGRGKVDKFSGDKVQATLCPQCSYEHVIVPMFRMKTNHYHCLLCKNTWEKRVNGKTIFYPVEVEKKVEFEADFEV